MWLSLIYASYQWVAWRVCVLVAAIFVRFWQGLCLTPRELLEGLGLVVVLVR